MRSKNQRTVYGILLGTALSLIGPLGIFTSNSSAQSPVPRFVYTGDAPTAANNVVNGYTIDATTGTLTLISGSPFVAGSGVDSLTVDPSGKFAYVANGGSNNISGYTIDANTGALTPIPGSPWPGA